MGLVAAMACVVAGGAAAGRCADCEGQGLRTTGRKRAMTTVREP